MVSQYQPKKKSGPIRGCLLPLLGLIGFIALCYVFCLVINILGNPNFAPEETSGALLALFG